MKDLLLATLFVTALNILLWATVANELSRPDVYKSWSTKNCVKVQSDSGHNCHNLPKKYNTIWVQ